MWMEADELVELFRGYLPYYLLIALPIFIIISPVCPVGASHEFHGFRMQQYDLHGVPHGCRSSSINLEARSLVSWGTSRHCVVAPLEELGPDQFREIRSKAGALLVILPRNIGSLPEDQQQGLLELEHAMMNEEVLIPVYFAQWHPWLLVIENELKQSYINDDGGDSAAEALLNTVSANGYQVVINAHQASPKRDVNVATIQGKLSGYGVEEKLPTIVVVAHYDSFGVAPELSYGADSNASGVSMLLELARLFSHLYASAKTHAHHNLIFLLTGAGKLNYHGSKKWLEDQLDGLEGSLVQDASFVLCLDSLAKRKGLFLHVSKPPREGTPGFQFFKGLKLVAEEFHPNLTVEAIHKKINLADEVLAWEHERYSIRRLPAFTLSSLKSHKHPVRSSILDIVDNLGDLGIVPATEIVAEALARHVFNLSQGSVFSNDLGVESESMHSWMYHLGSHPRSPQLLAHKQHPVVSTLKEAMSRYLKEVKVTYHTPDKRDPEFVFYDGTYATVNFYSVKPAVFDLFLTFAIVAYLGILYFVIQKFGSFFTLISSLFTSSKSRNY